jgi:hypothetical protein
MSIFQTGPEFRLIAEFDDKAVGFTLGTTISKTRSAWKYSHLVWRGEVDDNRCNLLVAPPEA